MTDHTTETGGPTECGFVHPAGGSPCNRTAGHPASWHSNVDGRAWYTEPDYRPASTGGENDA